MSKKQKTIPLTRPKSEEANPVISFRAPKELYDRLQAAKEKEGMSYTDILKAGLGLISVKMKAEGEIRRKAYDEGWQKGNEEAIEAFLVSYSCSVCGKEKDVDTADEKKAIRGYMRKNGWGHDECINR